jgi:glycosyltransferase involved in cell wall biosynthesis
MISFSVIIPSYNHAEFLAERIESILNQSWQDFEIIILDDASTDKSREVIQQYRNHPKIAHIIYSIGNSGLQSTQWQKGISIAKNDWIWIAESDDIAEPGFLEKAAASISAIKKNVLFYCDSIQYINGQAKDQNKKYSAIKNNFFYTQHWAGNYSVTGKEEINTWLKFGCTINNVSSAIFPKSLAQNILNDFSHLRYYNDWLFFIRLLQEADIAYSTECLNWYRIHPGSHFNKPIDPVIRRKETYSILNYLLKQSFITEKEKLVKFFTEQYLAFGLWTELKYLPAIFNNYIRINPGLFFKFLKYFILLKITREKIKYIF